MNLNTVADKFRLFLVRMSSLVGNRSAAHGRSLMIDLAGERNTRSLISIAARLVMFTALVVAGLS